MYNYVLLHSITNLHSDTHLWERLPLSCCLVKEKGGNFLARSCGCMPTVAKTAPGDCFGVTSPQHLTTEGGWGERKVVADVV